MKKVSVIVPAYNAEKYIEKCLDSVLAQSFSDFEIVVVNDGSKDATLDILKRYQTQYPEKITVISQDNAGLSTTRNNAIRASTGEYILFLDSDDYILPDMLKTLLEKAQSGDFDVVASDVDAVYPDKTVRIASGIDQDLDELSLEEKKKLFFGVYPTVWNKLYKRQIFQNQELFFEPGIWFEDVLFYHKLLPNIKSIGVVKESFYQYVQNAGSITYTYSDKLYDIHLVMEKILAYYKAQGLFEAYKDELEYMYVRYMFATFIKRLSKAKDRKVFQKGLAFAFQEVKRNFPRYRKNKHLTATGAKGLYLKFFNPLLAYATYFLEKNRMN